MSLADTLRSFFDAGPVVAQQVGGPAFGRAGARLATAAMLSLALGACGQSLSAGPSTLHYRETLTESSVRIVFNDSARDRACTGELGVAGGHVTGTLDCSTADSLDDATREAVEDRPVLQQSTVRRGNQVVTDYTLPEDSRLHRLATYYDLDENVACTYAEVRVGSHEDVSTTFVQVGDVQVPIIASSTVPDYEGLQLCRPISGIPSAQRQELRAAAEASGDAKLRARTAKALGL